MNGVTLKKCSKSGCLAIPTHVPTVCVPKRGIISKRNCYEAIMDIPCCLKHVQEPTVGEMLSPALQQMFYAQAAVKNGLAPDFNRAFMNWEPMTGVKYQNMVMQKRMKGRL